MSSSINNASRIGKNTLVLYVRMFFVLLLSLYTSRVVLRALGVDDFGLYNVIAGVVALFTFLRTSMEKATQRFLNVEMATPGGDVNKVFCINQTIHIFIAVIIFILAETIGLWFVNTYINIPAGREMAANYIYQFVVVSLCSTVITVPYSSCVIANEQMGFYAVVGVLDAVMKFLIALLISKSPIDQLIFYGALMMGISFINLLLYYLFCRKKYRDVTNFHIVYDRERYKEVFGFVSWTLVGQGAVLGTNHGNQILVNMFHGVVFNAAMSIGSQVNAAVVSLTSSFQTAFIPQITKSYASGNYTYLKKLIFGTSKISYILLFVVSLPISLKIDSLLQLWLGDVPEKANAFCILFLVNGILNALSAPLNYGVLATGKIRNFQIATAITYLLDLVFVYMLFKANHSVLTVMYVKNAIMVLLLVVRLFYASKEIPQIDFGEYCLNVILPLALATGITLALTFGVATFVDSGFTWVFTITIFLLSVPTFFFIGLSSEERKMLINMIKSIIHR